MALYGSISKKVGLQRFLLFVVYIFTPIYVFFYSQMAHRANLMQMLAIYTRPALLGYLVCYFIVSFLIVISFDRFASKADGSDEMNERINHYHKIHGWISILIPSINSIIFASLLSSSASKLGLPNFELLPMVLISIGTTFVFGMFFYLLWLDKVHIWLYFLPFTPKDTFLPIRLKVTVVAIMATLSLSFVLMVPLAGDHYKGYELSDILKAEIPMVITAVVALVLDFWVMIDSIKKKLDLMIRFAQDLSQGDYRREFLRIESRDDLGTLVFNFNLFQDKTKQLLKNLHNNVTLSENAAGKTQEKMIDISSSAKQIVSNIDTVQTQISNQSSGVQSSSAAINQITANIQNLNRNIETQGAAVEQSSAAVKEMVANIQSVTSILEKNSSSMDSLAVASKEGQKRIEAAVEMSQKIIMESSGLMEASSVIQAIAEQTNLLAMNAAIEAAHAGEAGKGFAVVADEIRKLAEQSNNQGKNISESLEGLNSVIQEVSQSTQELQKQFNVIFDLTNTVKEQEDVVMSAMKEQASGSTQILQAIKNIDESTSEVKHGAHEMLEGSNHVAQEMNNLDSSSKETVATVKQMSAGAENILSAVQEGREATENNTSSINNLTKEMNKFKL